MHKLLKLSHTKGATEEPLLTHTISEALDRAVRKWPDQDALVSVHQETRWTFRELKEKAVRVAAGLRSLGAGKGDRIGIWAPNMAEWTLVQFATAELGVILVNINPAYRLSELEFVLTAVGIKILLAPEKYKTSEYAIMMEALAPEIKANSVGRELKSAGLPALQHVVLIGDAGRPGWLNLSDVEQLATEKGCREVKEIASTLNPAEPINIQFTSGTTGLPKGAVLSHKSILNNGFFVGKNIGLSAGDRLCIPVPLYHCFGMVMGNLGCLTHGATMVYPAETFDAGLTLKAVEQEKCTGLFGVPTMFIAELAHPEFDTFDLSSLRTGCMAGSPCPVEVMRRVVDDMNMTDVTIAYGMTETSPVSFQSTPDDPIDRRVSTIGRALSHVECKIVDEAGNTVLPGVPGELCTKGYSVMIGYWDDEEKTNQVLRDGWMHTGDQGTIDAEGYGNIVGRIKDIIIRGGENIYPSEIEGFFFKHSKVEDITIVGVPDEKYGEEVCCWIRLKPGVEADAEEFRDYCKGQISHYKTPRYIEIVEEFPMTVTGKVRKIEIRDIMAAKLGLTDQETA
ncbi:MAG: AMP-binding protein [Parvibaculaceae bacterium]|nr:AMP-binding protein [Parvibaculaceae bacterium]